MITSYFTDPLEKTDSSNWADRKHTQDEMEETFMMETFSCAFSDSVLHRKAETPDETEPKFPETQQRSWIGSS